MLEKINGSATGIVHDDNGNRLGKSNTTTYKYDPEGRLTEANNLVRYKYDYSGKRVLRIDNTDPMNPEGFRYFTPEVETRNMPDQYWGRLTKHYFFGGVRVASRDVGWTVAPVQYASAETVPPVTIVASARGWGYEVRLRPDVQQMVPTLAFVGFVALVFLPDRRRRKVVGIRLRRGPTVLVVVLWTMGTFPGPVCLVPTQPAWANGGGGSAPPKPAEVLRHFHYDHLGSLQVMTTASGSAAQYIRYKPFGEERGRFNAALEPANPDAPLGLSKYAFTGYEQDGRTGLQYANARWYDPDLGQFATHDPKRVFDSPYNYSAWDPTNLTDPTGEDPFTIGAIIVAAFPVAAGIDAGIQTGDPMEGFKAFGVNLAIGILGAGVGSVVGPAISQVPGTLRLAATLGLGSYGVVSSVRNGAYVSAAVTFGNMVYSAHGIAGDAGNESGAVESGGPPDDKRPQQTLDLEPLPPGEGYYSTSPTNRQFAHPQTIEVVQDAGQRGAELGLPEFGVNDISAPGGGPFHPHAGHQLGVDIDIRPLTGTGTPRPVFFGQPSYSPDNTNQVIQLFRADPRVEVIYFNDTRIIGVTPYPKHSNHFHVRVRPR